jgi:myo-inositol-1(or 4)-monophosphatase
MSASVAEDLALLEHAARIAGAIIRDGFGKAVETWSKGAAGPVTAVDMAANAAIADLVRPARPSYGWLSEEGPDDPDRRARPRTIIVDPLDGTQAFLEKKPECAVSIGLCENGKPIAGAVYNPITDELFSGAIGFGATLNGAPITVSRRIELEDALLVGRAEWFKAKFWPSPWPPVRTVFKHSIAYRMALVAQGSADGATFLGYKHDWDIAAGAAIVLAAGGAVTTPWGDPLTLNEPQPRSPGVVASGPALHPLLCAQVTPTPHPRDWA